MIVCHMLVGPGEGDNRLALSLDRARAWADQVVCVLDPACRSGDKRVVDAFADAWWQGSPLFLLDERMARETAWNLMSIALSPTDDDWIVCLDTDEVIHQPSLVTKAAKTFTGKKVGFRVHHMWSRSHYRTDGRFGPRVEYLMFPYRKNAHWEHPRSRTPSYVGALMPIAEPLTDIIHYGYWNPELRQAKLERDRERGALGLAEILSEPQLEEWKKGGVR